MTLAKSAFELSALPPFTLPIDPFCILLSRSRRLEIDGCHAQEFFLPTSSHGSTTYDPYGLFDNFDYVC